MLLLDGRGRLRRGMYGSSNPHINPNPSPSPCPRPSPSPNPTPTPNQGRRGDLAEETASRVAAELRTAGMRIATHPKPYP